LGISASQQVERDRKRTEKKLSAINSHLKINGYNGGVAFSLLTSKMYTNFFYISLYGATIYDLKLIIIKTRK